MAAELTALKTYWASSLTGMHDLAMRQVIDGADALVSIGSNPTKVQVSHKDLETTQSAKVFGVGQARFKLTLLTLLSDAWLTSVYQPASTLPSVDNASRHQCKIYRPVIPVVGQANKHCAHDCPAERWT